MTYNDLFVKLCDFTPEQFSMDVTVYDHTQDEFFKVEGDLNIMEEDDVLDKNHPFLVI